MPKYGVSVPMFELDNELLVRAAKLAMNSSASRLVPFYLNEQHRRGN